MRSSDDEGPGSGTEVMTDGPGMVDGTADDEKMNAYVATVRDAQQAS